MKIIIYSIVLLTFFSCQEDAKELQADKEKRSIIVSDSLQPIVDSLAAYNIVEDETIGHYGTKSKVYQCFEKLNEVSTAVELLKLTDHEIPSVRVYAFWALAKRGTPKVKEILLNHLDDTAKFRFVSESTVFAERVNTFFLDILTPHRIDSGCFRLSTEEVIAIKAKMEYE